MEDFDSPVSTKNIIESRLRPRSALSFVYGKIRKRKTPTTKYSPKREDSFDDDNEVEDPSFIPHSDDVDVDDDADETADSEQWSRLDSEQTPLKNPSFSPVANLTPAPRSLPKSKSKSKSESESESVHKKSVTISFERSPARKKLSASTPQSSSAPAPKSPPPSILKTHSYLESVRDDDDDDDEVFDEVAAAAATAAPPSAEKDRAQETDSFCQEAASFVPAKSNDETSCFSGFLRRREGGGGGSSCLLC